MWASLVAQAVKNLPTVWETWVRSLDQQDFLEKGMATHSRILAWRIPRTGKPGGLQPMGSQRVGHDWVIKTHTTSLTGGRGTANSFRFPISNILWLLLATHWAHIEIAELFFNHTPDSCPESSLKVPRVRIP